MSCCWDSSWTSISCTAISSVPKTISTAVQILRQALLRATAVILFFCWLCFSHCARHAALCRNRRNIIIMVLEARTWTQFPEISAWHPWIKAEVNIKKWPTTPVTHPQVSIHSSAQFCSQQRRLPQATLGVDGAFEKTPWYFPLICTYKCHLLTTWTVQKATVAQVVSKAPQITEP